MIFSNLDSWSLCRQQGRNLLASQVRLEARAEIVQHVALLLSAGGDHRQHPLHKPAAIGTVGPAADPPPDHRMSQRPFRPIVGRLDPSDAHEGPQRHFHLEDLKARRGRLAQPQLWPLSSAALTARRNRAAMGVIAPVPGIMRLFWAFSPSNPPESPSQEDSSLANMLDTLEARCRSDGPPAGPRSIDPLPGSRSFLTVSAVA